MYNNLLKPLQSFWITLYWTAICWLYIYILLLRASWGKNFHITYYVLFPCPYLSIPYVCYIHIYIYIYIYIKVSQGVPGRVRPRIFFTFWHYKVGRSSAKRTGCLYLRRIPWYSLSEAESTSRHMVLSGVPRKISPVKPPGIDPETFRLIAQCLNHYATPGLKNGISATLK